MCRLFQTLPQLCCALETAACEGLRTSGRRWGMRGIWVSGAPPGSCSALTCISATRPTPCEPARGLSPSPAPAPGSSCVRPAEACRAPGDGSADGLLSQRLRAPGEETAAAPRAGGLVSARALAPASGLAALLGTVQGRLCFVLVREEGLVPSAAVRRFLPRLPLDMLVWRKRFMPSGGLPLASMRRSVTCELYLFQHGLGPLAPARASAAGSSSAWRPWRTCPLRLPMSRCTGAMSPRTSCLARRSSSSAGSQTVALAPQACSAATSLAREALPSCRTSRRSKTSCSRTPGRCTTRMRLAGPTAGASGGSGGSRSPSLRSARPKASKSRGLVRGSGATAKASRTWP
mmetsp:Transcript_3666/g.11507  ORF Transcript_3666/g.11507 Transcript_3666/m.11507 type:complete len:347 (-) Transcript_3666:1369-2409(-)